jgi:hypothetical protein
MINDGHIHLHYGIEQPDEIILKQMPRIEEYRRRYNVDKMGAIILPCNVTAIPEISRGRDFLRLGVYFRGADDVKRYKGPVEQLDFAKFNIEYYTIYPQDLLRALEAATQSGFRRFQLHTERISTETLKIFERFIDEFDAKIYLAHGVYALYPNYPEKHYTPAMPDDIKRLAGNLFLGTTPYCGGHEDPNEGLEKAIKDKLDDLVCFETDFAMWWPNDTTYGFIIEAARKVVGNHEKVMHDNFLRFIE